MPMNRIPVGRFFAVGFGQHAMRAARAHTLAGLAERRDGEGTLSDIASRSVLILGRFAGPFRCRDKGDSRCELQGTRHAAPAVAVSTGRPDRRLATRRTSYRLLRRSIEGEGSSGPRDLNLLIDDA
jgi:hypothetical protein